MKIGKIDLARQFLTPLEKTPQKNRYTYEALIEFSNLNGESDKALEYVNDAIKNNPKLVSFYLLKADMMIKLKKFDEVESLLAKADDLNLENNDLNRAKYLELKGLLIAIKGDPAKATSYFEKSLSIEDSIELRMRLADLSASDETKPDTAKLITESKALKFLMQAKDFYAKRSYQLALSSAAKAADISTGHIPSELYLAKVQLKLGLVKQGLKTLEDLIKKYPKDRSINLALIDAYIETYKFNDAKNRIGIMSATELKSSYEFASANGRLYIRMGDPLQAISWLRNSININPLNDGDIFLLSELLIKRSNFDPAKLLLNKCMELDPINPDYRIAYSRIVYEQQDDQAAIGYLLGLLNEFGENPKILSEIAIMYYRAGRIKDFQAYKEKLEKMPVKDKALYEFLIRAALLDERYAEIPELVEQLLVIEPGETEAMMTAGRVLFESGKLVEAATWFKRIRDRLETYPKVQYYIAKISFLGKKYDEALAEVEADLKSNGDNDADLTLMAQIWTEKGDLVQAENLYKRSQKINPKNYESLMGLADISTKRNNFDLALDLYKKAMTLKSDESLIHRKIGDVYRLLGQGALAVESYKLYLEMNPEAADKNQIQSYINLMQ
jgi:tetratricopeptide (TPR) repeat protein